MVPPAEQSPAGMLSDVHRTGTDQGPCEDVVCRDQGTDLACLALSAISPMRGDGTVSWPATEDGTLWISALDKYHVLE